MTEKPVIYTDAYYARLFEVEERHWWCLGMRAVAAALLRAVLGAPRPRLVLDAGCGSGASLVWLEEFAAGGGVHGIDLAIEALRFSRSRGLRRLAQASVLALPFRSERFDLVVSVDVFQHLPVGGGDAAAVREAFRVLAPGGQFLLRTNCAAPGRRNRPEFVDFHWYAEREARALLERGGFEVVRSTHANVVADVAARARAVAASALGRGAGRPTGSGLPEPPPQRSLAHSLLLRTMRLEAGWVGAGGAIPSGGSLLLLGRKPRG